MANTSGNDNQGLSSVENSSNTNKPRFSTNKSEYLFNKKTGDIINPNVDELIDEDIITDDEVSDLDDNEPIDESYNEPQSNFGSNRYIETRENSVETSSIGGSRKGNYLTDRQIRERAEVDPNFDAEAVKKERNNEANTNAIRTATDVAEKSGNPIATGIAKGIKTADAVTGGGATEKLGKDTSRALNVIPEGKDVQNKINAANAAMKGDFEGAKDILIEGAKQNFFRRILKYLPAILLAIFIIGIVAVALMFIFIFIQNLMGMFRFPYLPNNFANYITIKDSSGNKQNIDIDTYVAGVVYGEVGEFSSSEETLRAAAVAARTFALYMMEHQGYLRNSANDQVSKMVPAAIGEGSVYMKAATDTSGVVLAKNNKIYLSQYDALAVSSKCGGSEDDTYYTLCQQGLKIPKDWARSNGLSESRANYYKKHYHGNGMSQWGAYYLGKAKGKDFEYILNYFYPDAELMSIYEYSIDPLNASNTQTNSELHQPLGEFLKNHGSSMKSLNDEILTSVLTYGPGTGAAVAASAVTLISIMDQQYSVLIPYYWGGGQGASASHNYKPWNYYGANKYWGEHNCTYANNKSYCYIGLDCAGFVTWAIHNGGVNIHDTQTFYTKGKGVSVYKGEQASPGDILKHPGHIMLVLSYDKKSQKYKVAQAAGHGKGVKINDISVSYLSGADYKLYLMGDAYKKNAVKNYEEKFQEKRMD